METEEKREMPESMKKWVDFAKAQKLLTVQQTQRGDITPTVIVEREGEVLALIISPEVNRDDGLKAASFAKMGFEPDAMVLLFDAHMAAAEKKPEGMSDEEYSEEFAKKYPHGSMQKMCDEEGACEAGQIADCLLCFRVDREGKSSSVYLPYSYHGKDGPPFEWLDNEKFKTMWMDDSEEGCRVEGTIPETLRDIMASKPILDAVPGLQAFAEGMSEEKRRFHTGRAVLAFLSSQNYKVCDFVTKKHPEWVDGAERAKEIVQAFFKKGGLPKEAIQPLENLIINNPPGTPEFQSKLMELIADHPYWFPQTVRKDSKGFALHFESAALAPHVPGDDQEEKKSADHESKRVRVWNGDQSKYLGEGNWVGDVKVFYIRMPDGSLRSTSNAEVEPDPADVPPDAVVVSSEDNPKIVLDSGRVVYGCQVWFEETSESMPLMHGYNKAR